jgi:hypothetical protein
MSECSEYARSLINNLSLLSKLVLIPTPEQLKTMCLYLQNLKKRYQPDMIQLIYGSDQLNKDPDFQKLKQLVTTIQRLQGRPSLQGPLGLQPLSQ